MTLLLPVTSAKVVRGETDRYVRPFTDADRRMVVRVGSGPECNWRVHAPGVASHHFMLIWDRSELTIINIGERVEIDGHVLVGTATVYSARLRFGDAAIEIESSHGDGVVHHGMPRPVGSAPQAQRAELESTCNAVTSLMIREAARPAAAAGDGVVTRAVVDQVSSRSIAVRGVAAPHATRILEQPGTGDARVRGATPERSASAPARLRNWRWAAIVVAGAVCGLAAAVVADGAVVARSHGASGAASTFADAGPSHDASGDASLALDAPLAPVDSEEQGRPEILRQRARAAHDSGRDCDRAHRGARRRSRPCPERSTEQRAAVDLLAAGRLDLAEERYRDLAESTGDGAYREIVRLLSYRRSERCANGTQPCSADRGDR